MHLLFHIIVSLAVTGQVTAQTPSNSPAAPSIPGQNMAEMVANGAGQLSEWFNILSADIESSSGMDPSSCQPSQEDLPKVDGLETPVEGLIVRHVAIGRGTQNYTCDSTNSTAIPSAQGAVAILYDATCIAASYPDLLSSLPGTALEFNLSLAETVLPFTAPRRHLSTSGVHFFTGPGVPFFNLDTPDIQLGQIKAELSGPPVEPPPGAPVGQGFEPAVNWLRLLAREETGAATGNLAEVFRVETAGGAPPQTCTGMPATFEVEYAAQYWFFAIEEGDDGSVADTTLSPARQDVVMGSSYNLEPRSPALIVLFMSILSFFF